MNNMGNAVGGPPSMTTVSLQGMLRDLDEANVDFDVELVVNAPEGQPCHFGIQEITADGSGLMQYYALHAETGEAPIDNLTAATIVAGFYEGLGRMSALVGTIFRTIQEGAIDRVVLQVRQGEPESALMRNWPPLAS